MADKKISALTSAATPLAGTEVFPLVQSGTTVKTPVSSVVTSGLTASFGAVTATATGIPAITAIRDLDVGVVGDAAQTIALGAKSGTTPTAGADILGVLEASATSGRLAIRTLTSGSMTSKLTVSNAGDVTANLGNVVIGTAGKGIDFSANGGDVLTQYDQGTWVPADISGAGLTISVTGGTSVKYTRVGNVVYFAMDITYPATADASVARVSIPVASSSTGPNGFGTITFKSDGIFAVGNIGTSGIIFVGPLNTFLTNADLSGVRLAVSGFYFTA